jgi:hypothetical protein
VICRRRPELAFYLLNLWMRAWHDRPAASIENDDDVLADAAGCPRDRWPSIKDDLLRGWILCSDARLYHPVIAQLALEAWGKRVLYRWNRECARIRKENQRRKEAG